MSEPQCSATAPHPNGSDHECARVDGHPHSHVCGVCGHIWIVVRTWPAVADIPEETNE